MLEHYPEYQRWSRPTFQIARFKSALVNFVIAATYLALVIFSLSLDSLGSYPAFIARDLALLGLVSLATRRVVTALVISIQAIRPRQYDWTSLRELHEALFNRTPTQLTNPPHRERE